MGIATAEKEFVDCNILGVSVETTGYCGGDGGHGGRHVLRLEDLSSTSMEMVETGAYGAGHTIELVFCGDSELKTLIDGLRWAADALEQLASIMNGTEAHQSKKGQGSP